MAKISFNGSRNGVQVDRNYGSITVSGGRVQVSGSASDDDTSDVTTVVNGVQVAENFGDITIG